MADIVIYLACLILIAGAAFSLIAAIGVVRLPDFFTRTHAASKAGAVGGGLVLLSVALLCFDVAIALRAILAIMFLLLTAPIAAHLLARASYRITDQLRVNMVTDELKSKSNQSPDG